ncbi:24337_t:CDS:1, partial [Dentiscutata erythropus]
ELPKENIHVSNLKENSKENAKNLANLDTMIIHIEEITKKNNETDDKLKSLYIQKEVENQLLLNKTPRDKLTIEDLAQTFALQKFDMNKKENTPPNIDDEGFITVSNKKKNNRKNH